MRIPRPSALLSPSLAGGCCLVLLRRFAPAPDRARVEAEVKPLAPVLRGHQRHQPAQLPGALGRQRAGDHGPHVAEHVGPGGGLREPQGADGLAAGDARADVRVPALFSDNLVLQQGKRVPVWGWAEDGEKITVSFRGKKVSTTAHAGKWMVKLPSQKAGGPDTLTIEGKNKIELKNVLVGEVWVASGQSNMEWPMARSFEPEREIANSAHPNLRLFTVPKLRADAPVDDVKASWKECNADAVRNFSAVAYYFGRDLQKARGVPVGLIHTSWGGSPAEVWISKDVLESNPRYQSEILDPYPAAQKRFQEETVRWEKEAEELKKQGKQPTRNRPGQPWKPNELYNGMIAPLIPYAIAGAIWYQGESNAGRAW